MIVGGYENTIDENSSYSVIVGGGSPNLAEGNAISNSIYSTIVGGKSNQIMDEVIIQPLLEDQITRSVENTVLQWEKTSAFLTIVPLYFLMDQNLDRQPETINF